MKENGIQITINCLQ